MGRIGKTYPRFRPGGPQAAPDEGERICGLHVFGALIGIIAALGLIGFLITR